MYGKKYGRRKGDHPTKDGKPSNQYSFEEMEFSSNIEVPEGKSVNHNKRNKILNVTRPSGIRVLFPKGDEKVLKITGDVQKELEEVEMKIKSILTFKPRQELTHFLSIPLNIKEFQDRFLEFKKDVLEKHAQKDFDESVFQRITHLHMTFGVMSLSSEAEEKRACQVLESCKSFLEPLKIELKGLGFLGEDMQRSRVVYAKIADPAKLQVMADRVVEVFSENQLMEKSPVTLHTTLMNTTFSQRHFESTKWNRDRSTRPTQRPSRFFNASHLLDAYKDFIFAKEINVNEVHISHFGRKGADGYYLPLYKLSLM